MSIKRFDIATNHTVDDVPAVVEKHGACRWQGSPYFRRTISGRTPTYISVRQTVHTPYCHNLLYRRPIVIDILARRNCSTVVRDDNKN